jgi:GT2 family glycosyltransferase
MQSLPTSVRIAVGIPTSGRSEIVRLAIDCIGRQTRAPDRLVICASRPSDLANLDLAAAQAEGLMSPRGLTRQRNAILDHCRDFDVVVFFDDDFLPHARYLESIERIFAANSNVAMVTGRVLADGILGPGLVPGDALALLDAVDRESDHPPELVDVYNGYGCNMSVRLSAVRAGSLAFDEALPLYGWLEDVDFSRRLAAHGRIVKCATACGVHLGAKSGRQSGVGLGYSQIANPIYLARKGTLARHRAARQIAKNVAKNLTYSLWPEPFVDRRGRARGNLQGAVDLLRNRLHPMHVLQMPTPGRPSDD